MFEREERTQRLNTTHVDRMINEMLQREDYITIFTDLKTDHTDMSGWYECGSHSFSLSLYHYREQADECNDRVFTEVKIWDSVTKEDIDWKDFSRMQHHYTESPYMKDGNPEGFFLNISNHPSKKWSKDQIQAARKLANGYLIEDMPFPNIDPSFDSYTIDKIVEDLIWQIKEAWVKHGQPAILVQGEMVTTHRLVKALQEEFSIPVVAAISERVSKEITNPDGSVTKTSEFKFRGFRNY